MDKDTSDVLKADLCLATILGTSLGGYLILGNVKA